MEELVDTNQETLSRGRGSNSRINPGVVYSDSTQRGAHPYIIEASRRVANSAIISIFPQSAAIDEFSA